MKCRALFLLLCSLFVGCSSFPRNPEWAGWDSPDRALPDDAAKDVNERALDGYRAAFGGDLPASFVHQSASGWFSQRGQLKQVRSKAKISRAEFAKHFARENWTKRPIPKAEREVMHLPRDVPEDYAVCFVGKVDGTAAALMWSAEFESLFLIRDL